MTMADPSATYDVALTASGVLRLPGRLRERYLTPATENSDCVVQSSGMEVRIWIESARSDVRLVIPRETFEAGRSYEHSIYRWGININRYVGDGGVAVEYEGERATVPVTVERVEVER